MNEQEFEETIEIEMPKSRVYAKLDEQNRIVAIEGEYSLSNIDNFDEWTLIEKGEPCDRLNLAQSHYFEGGLFTDDIIPRYKWNGQKAIARTETEIETDRAAIPKPKLERSQEERLTIMENALQEMAIAMALGDE